MQDARWTVVAEWADGTREEVDVDAADRTEARAKARAELAEHTPGWEIATVIGPREGFYL